MKKEEKYWGIGFFFSGIMFSIPASLVASVFERNLEKYGVIYDVGVIVVFLGLLFWVDRFFTKLISGK